MKHRDSIDQIWNQSKQAYTIYETKSTGVLQFLYIFADLF